MFISFPRKDMFFQTSFLFPLPWAPQVSLPIIIPPFFFSLSLLPPFPSFFLPRKKTILGDDLLSHRFSLLSLLFSLKTNKNPSLPLSSLFPHRCPLVGFLSLIRNNRNQRVLISFSSSPSLFYFIFIFIYFFYFLENQKENFFFWLENFFSW